MTKEDKIQLATRTINIATGITTEPMANWVKGIKIKTATGTYVIEVELPKEKNLLSYALIDLEAFNQPGGTWKVGDADGVVQHAMEVLSSLQPGRPPNLIYGRDWGIGVNLRGVGTCVYIKRGRATLNRNDLLNMLKELDK